VDHVPALSVKCDGAKEESYGCEGDMRLNDEWGGQERGKHHDGVLLSVGFSLSEIMGATLFALPLLERLVSCTRRRAALARFHE